MDITADQLQRALYYLAAFIVSVTVHEFGHAWVATRLGDATPRAQGRLTLSPLAHIDLIGTVAMPLASALFPGTVPFLAWGKPVETNPMRYTRRMSPRVGQMLVALAGPMMNLVLALVVSAIYIPLAKAGVLPLMVAAGIIQYLVQLNILLLFFNLIPLPPLDGGAVLAGLLPDSLQVIPQTLRRYGLFIFFGLLLTGAFRVLLLPAKQLSLIWGSALLRMVLPA
jgi:Zn-dependent protease